MTPTQFKQIRKDLGLSVNDMAKALRLSSDRTIRRMENGDMPISGPVSLLMEVFDALGLDASEHVCEICED